MGRRLPRLEENLRLAGSIGMDRGVIKLDFSSLDASSATAGEEA
jgi:hypothetical protein